MMKNQYVNQIIPSHMMPSTRRQQPRNSARVNNPRCINPQIRTTDLTNLLRHFVAPCKVLWLKICDAAELARAPYVALSKPSKDAVIPAVVARATAIGKAFAFLVISSVVESPVPGLAFLPALVLVDGWDNVITIPFRGQFE